MSEPNKTDFNTASTARESNLTREALMEAVLTQIFTVSKTDPKRGHVATLINKPSGNAEDADFVIDFLENWFVSAHRNISFMSHWNIWSLTPLIKRGVTESNWEVLKNPIRIGMGLGPSDWFAIKLAEVNKEIISANSGRRTLKVDGERLWDTLIIGIETGRPLAAMLRDDLQKTERHQDKTIKHLQAITDSIDLLSHAFAGLPPKMVTALKDEILNPLPFDKQALTDIKHKLGITPRKTPKSKPSGLRFIEEEIARNNGRRPTM
jgi:hypothetical protein